MPITAAGDGSIVAEAVGDAINWASATVGDVEAGVADMVSDEPVGAVEPAITQEEGSFNWLKWIGNV